MVLILRANLGKTFNNFYSLGQTYSNITCNVICTLYRYCHLTSVFLDRTGHQPQGDVSGRTISAVTSDICVGWFRPSESHTDALCNIQVTHVYNSSPADIKCDITFKKKKVK